MQILDLILILLVRVEMAVLVFSYLQHLGTLLNHLDFLDLDQVISGFVVAVVAAVTVVPVVKEEVTLMLIMPVE